MRQVGSLPLWIGHAGDRAAVAALHAAGIRAVVDLAANEASASLPRESAYLRFPLSDGAGNPPWLLRGAVECVASLLRFGVPTLVCCSAGMSRSPAVAAAALALTFGRPAADCLEEAGGRDVSPGLWRAVTEIVAAK